MVVAELAIAVVPVSSLMLHQVFFPRIYSQLSSSNPRRDIESNPGLHSTFICPVYEDHIEDLPVSVVAR